MLDMTRDNLMVCNDTRVDRMGAFHIIAGVLRAHSRKMDAAGAQPRKPPITSSITGKGPSSWSSYTRHLGL